jgi:hypothetical protein
VWETNEVAFASGKGGVRGAADRAVSSEEEKGAGNRSKKDMREMR